MLILKFGGSSVKNAERIRAVKDIILSLGDSPKVIVFSALGNTTDTLLAAGNAALESSYSESSKAVLKEQLTYLKNLHEQAAAELEINCQLLENLFSELEQLLQGVSLLRELSPKTKDYLSSFGERLAVRLISTYLNSQNFPSQYYDAFDLGLKSNSNFGDAEVDQSCLPAVKSELEKSLSSGKTPIVTGFIAKDSQGNITTLGRGGSDLTASLLAASLNAKEVQVWKDVNGILTTDPRIVPEAKSLRNISFDEASELAYFGAKVLHPLSILPAMKANIPVRVLNSYNPAHPGTAIVKKTEHRPLIRALTCKRNITLIDIASTRMLDQSGFLANIFNIFKDAKISIDMLASSEVSVSLTLNHKDSVEAIVAKLSEFSTVKVEKHRAILSLIGDVEHSSEILNRVFSILDKRKTNVEMISQGASKVNISFVLNDSEVESTLSALHEYFMSEDLFESQLAG